MRNQAISESSLDKSIYHSDRLKNEFLNEKKKRINSVKRSVVIANKHSHSFSIIKVFDKKDEKHKYFLDRFEEKLILRKCAKNLSKNISVRENDRHQCVREIVSTLKWNSDQQIYRIDLAKYYESIPKKEIINFIEHNTGITNQTKQLSLSVLRKYWRNFGTGLPRGLEISSPIARAILSKMDEDIYNSENCLYYARFVDDILLITSPEDKGELYKLIKRSLPTGVRLNTKKTSQYTKSEKGFQFEFLGYSFTVSERKTRYREIGLDLSSSRRKKIKSKIFKSFQGYVKDNDFELLLDRLNFISSNRTVHRGNGKYKTGITYNNRECSLEKVPEGIKEINSFYQALILNKGLGAIKNKVKLSSAQASELFKINFDKRYLKKYHFNVSYSRYEEIAKVWQK